jgi:site-specific recombinase XerD
MGATARSQQHSDFGAYFASLTAKCLDSERVRGLSGRSLSELHRCFTLFNEFVLSRGITDIAAFSPQTIKDFLLQVNPISSPAQGKMYVWSIRKLFGFLSLRQIVTDNPARHLPHPKARPREKLPMYLKPAEIRSLLETAAAMRSLQEFTILSLLVTAGPRPHEIGNLRVQDIFLEEQYIFLRVKGNWYKRTPISASMAETFRDYISAYAPTGPALFLNTWKRPVDRRWVERLVRGAARQAGIRHTVTPNMLRHTFATWCADRHGAIVTRALLGHCSRSHSTDVYMHLIPGKFRVLMNLHPYQTMVRTSRRDQ